MEILILDVDPVLAARSLTTQLMQNYIIALKCTFTVCHRPSLHKRYANNFCCAVKYSSENYIWFSQFYETLTDIVKSKVEIADFDESYVFDVEGVAFKNNGLSLYPDSKLSIQDQIDVSRATFIKRNYHNSKFPCGLPSWYILTDCKIYEKYDYKLCKSFKVMHEKGRLRYYVAEYFNQWREIKDVPLEMDDFIKHFIRKEKKKK